MRPGAAVLVVVVAALVGAAIFFARTRSGPVHRFDVTSAADLNRYVAGHPGEVSFWKVLTDIGGPLTWRVLAGAAAVALWLARRRRDAIVVVVAMIAAAVLSGAMKALVDRHRPIVPDPVDHVSGGSFPSGHALTSFTAFGLLVLLLWPVVSHLWRTVVVVVAALVVAVIGFSRLILGVHYVTDVLGGWLIALLLLLIVGLAVPRAPDRS